MSSVDDLVSQVTELTYATDALTNLVTAQLDRLIADIDLVDAKIPLVISASDSANAAASAATNAATKTAEDVQTITGLVEQNVFAPSFIELSTNLIDTQNIIVTMHPTY